VAGTKKYYLVFPSYDAILDYNCSHSYAITVGLLSDRIATAPALPAKKSATPSKRAA
jgi:membrane-bound lytic murein transglycosylase B